LEGAGRVMTSNNQKSIEREQNWWCDEMRNLSNPPRHRFAYEQILSDVKKTPV